MDKVYTCPMHSEVKSDKPGKCSKCGVNLVLEELQETEKNKHLHGHFSKTDGDGQQPLCPVMEGVAVDKEEAERERRVREYKDKKYYLCCDTCVTLFDANPEQYAKSR